MRINPVEIKAQITFVNVCVLLLLLLLPFYFLLHVFYFTIQFLVEWMNKKVFISFLCFIVSHSPYICVWMYIFAFFCSCSFMCLILQWFKAHVPALTLECWMDIYRHVSMSEIRENSRWLKLFNSKKKMCSGI